MLESETLGSKGPSMGNGL